MLLKDRLKFFESEMSARLRRKRSEHLKEVEMQLEFPQEFSRPGEKILYSLWREGGQNFMNLLLLTGLKASEAKKALKELRELGLINEENPVNKGSINCFYQLYQPHQPFQSSTGR